MTAALVQMGPQASCIGATTLTASLSGATPGNFAVFTVAVSYGDTTTPAPAIATPSGWSVGTAATGALGTGVMLKPAAAIFYRAITGSSVSATVTFPSNSFAYGEISEFSGIDTTAPVNISFSNRAGSLVAGTLSSGTTSTTVADALLVVIGHPDDTVGGTTQMSTPPVVGFTTLGHSPDNATVIAYGSAYKVLTAKGVQTAQWTWKKRSFFAGAMAAFKAVPGGAPTLVAPGAGNVAISGHAPTIAQPQGAAPGAGALALTGFAPTIAQPHSVAPGVGSVTLTGHAPTVTQSLALQPGAGSVVLTGHAPNVGQPQGVAPGAGSMVLTGYAPTVAQPVTQRVLPGAGLIVLTGHAPTVTQGVSLPPGFEIGGAREVSFKPLLQRILDARSDRRVKPAKERAAKRAKVIEVQAAQSALEEGGESQFRALMQQWLAQRPVIPAGTGLEAQLAFMAQVAFRIQQMQAEEQARVRIAAQIDEEEALIALLLA